MGLFFLTMFSLLRNIFFSLLIPLVFPSWVAMVLIRRIVRNTRMACEVAREDLQIHKFSLRSRSSRSWTEIQADWWSYNPWHVKFTSPQEWWLPELKWLWSEEDWSMHQDEVVPEVMLKKEFSVQFVMILQLWNPFAEQKHGNEGGNNSSFKVQLEDLLPNEKLFNEIFSSRLLMGKERSPSCCNRCSHLVFAQDAVW